MTRAERAREVWDRILLGPAFSASPTVDFTPAEATAAYRRWVDSWVVNDVALLVPELRSKLGALGYVTHAKMDADRSEASS